MKKKDVIFERKEFLNLPGLNGMANIVAQIKKSSWGNSDKNSRNLEVNLSFADCDRKVSMAMSIDEDSYENKNTLYKVDTLIDVLTEFRDVLEIEAKIQKKLKKKRKKSEKK